MNEEEIETLKAGLRLLKAKEVKPEKKVTTKVRRPGQGAGGVTGDEREGGGSCSPSTIRLSCRLLMR